MIYLTTGGNGAGKTLFTLKDVREQQLKENRPVYFHGFTAKQQLLDWGWQQFDPKKWQDLPDGSICIFDECQNEFPAKMQGELPDYINAVAQFRRKRGFDFWMITPHPSMIHLNIRRLIESPSWHRHMKRNFGTDMVSELRFNFAEMKCEQPGAGKSGQVTTRLYPKEVYDWYESASLHTGKKKIPKQVWMLLVCVIAIPSLFYFGFKQVTKVGDKAAAQAVAGAPGGPGHVGQSGPANRPVTVGEYLESRKPRLPDFPHTAPVYDEVTKAVTAPYPAACVSQGERCKCFTQQATPIKVSHSICTQIVENGYFLDWEPDKHKQAQQQQQQQMRAAQQRAQPVQSQPQYQQASFPAPPQPQERVQSWEERMAERNASVVSTIKR
jgi:zona occludens toxin